MKEVAASEFDVLTVAKALFQRAGGGAVEWQLRRKREVPGKFHPVAVDLFEDTLAKGVMLALVRRGGWARERSVAGEQIRSGRLWQRHDPIGLQFSPLSLELCRWLVSTELSSPSCPPLSIARAGTMGDELMLYLAIDLARQVGCGEALAAQRAVRSSPLCWLGFAALLGRAGAIHDDVDFSTLATGEGAVIVEALQHDLERRWLEMERGKGRVIDCKHMVAIGEAQREVLARFTSAANAAGRRDLADFLVGAATHLDADDLDAMTWIESLDMAQTLSARSGARHGAATVLRSLATLHGWVEEARVVRFFEDGYDIAQLFLERWERLGDVAYRRLIAIADELESLQAIEGETS